MTRPPTPEEKINVALEPAAQPLGLYDRPAQMEPSPLHEVAKSLSSLSTDLNQWGEKQIVQQKQDDAIKAQADAFNATKDGWAEGIRTDQLPANASPYYSQAYRSAMGTAVGFQLQPNFEAAFDNSDVKNNPDPQAFDQWFANTTHSLVKNNDPYFLKGIEPHLRAIQSSLLGKWQTAQQQNTQYAAQTSFGAAAAGAIDDVMQDWRQDTQEDGEPAYRPDFSSVAAGIEKLQQTGFSAGMKSSQIDKVLIDAIQTKALQYRDQDILKLLDAKSASGPSLRDTPYGQDVEMKTNDTLDSLWRREASEERLKQEREDRLAANQAKASIVDQILKDPKAPIDERLISTVQKVDGNFKLDIMDWRNKVLNDQASDDPRKVNQLTQDILQGGDGMAKLMSAIRAGDIGSQDAVTKALGTIKSVQDFNKSGSGILNTAAAKTYQSQIEEMGAAPGYDRILGAPPVLTEDARTALNSYRYDMMKWGLQNPNVSVLDQERYAHELGETILKSFKPASNSFQEGPRFTPPPSVSPEANMPLTCRFR